MLVVLLQSVAVIGWLAVYKFFPPLHDNNAFFWHPFLYLVAFAFQNITSHYMKRRQRNVLVHIGLAGVSTTCSFIGGRERNRENKKKKKKKKKEL
jgi:hypothetical protein